MLSAETAIRLIVIGQEVLIAAIFLFSRGDRATRFSGAFFMLSLVGYLFVSDPVLRDSLPQLLPLAVLLALIVPYCLWLFARAIFESDWPRSSLTVVAAAIAVASWVIYLADDALSASWSTAANGTMHIAALLVVAHALWLAVNGRPDDLLENRRSFRLLFVVLVSIQVAAVLLVELAVGESPLPAWLDLTNVIIIAALTIGLATPILRLNPELFAIAADTGAAETPQPEETFTATERVLHVALLKLMQDGVYRETGLTIKALATKLSYPEHQLRRLINGRLGYRNFSAFLNSYRIDEAKSRLADPAHARLPVLSIALDLGYASLGPFNRAFKLATGTTPTDHRRQHLGRARADSE